MSYTEIYRLGNEPGCIGEAKNAWRGAMFVWNETAKRYCDMENFPMFGPGQKRVWNAYKHPEMPEWERIVLLTTLDHMIVFAKDRQRLVDAFNRYAIERGGNLDEQARVINTAIFGVGDSIAWNQTSVMSDPWFQQIGGRSDDDNENVSWYDPQVGDKHIDVMGELSQ